MGGGNASGVLRGWEGGWVDDEHDDIREMRYGHTNVGVGMWIVCAGEGGLFFFHAADVLTMWRLFDSHELLSFCTGRERDDN